MRNRVYRFIALAAGLMLASGCSGDNPTSPVAQLDTSSASGSLVSAIKSDIAASAGNAIASDVESLIANEAGAVGSFATFASAVNGEESSTPPASPPNCTAGSQAGVFFCVKQPGPNDHLKCSYSEEKKLYVCVKEEPAASPPSGGSSSPAGDQPKSDPAPVKPSECSFDGKALIYSCRKSGDGKSVVKSYQFLDGSGNPMEKFVKGTTEAIHYLVKTDASEARENFSSATHSLRDQTLSGFLGPNRIWNGVGASADTNSHREDLSTRKYTGSSVDTVKAVTFVDERATHPYPLSGVAIRVVDYTVVSTGRQTETTSVHKRVVVTFNGSADVPIVLGDYNCVLHLDTHKVDSCK
ncbi:MAG: hypothetical protein ABR585_13525 [Gemmatimonadaceae bacterium]